MRLGWCAFYKAQPCNLLICSGRKGPWHKDTATAAAQQVSPAAAAGHCVDMIWPPLRGAHVSLFKRSTCLEVCG